MFRPLLSGAGLAAGELFLPEKTAACHSAGLGKGFALLHFVPALRVPSALAPRHLGSVGTGNVVAALRAGSAFRLRRGPNREHVKIYRLFYYRSDKISDLNLSFFLF